MVMEFSDHDLTGLTDAGTRFTTPQIKCYMKQLLEGLAYCHRNRVLHRDIKGARPWGGMRGGEVGDLRGGKRGRSAPPRLSLAPAGSNLLINNQGQLKLADFGLARPFDDTGRQLTNRVITLWYRPPELLLGSQNYGPAVDMWSVGCIFAELLLKRPILPGKNEFEQIDKIFKMFGTPTEETWPGLTKLHYYQMVQQQVGTKPQPNRFNEHFGMCARAPPAPPRPPQPPALLLRADAPTRVAAPGPADPLTSTPTRLPQQAQSLLQRLLAMDPSKRISAKDALDHDYFWEEPYLQARGSAQVRAEPRVHREEAPGPSCGWRRRRRSPPTNRYHTSDLRTSSSPPTARTRAAARPTTTAATTRAATTSGGASYDNGGGYAADRRPRLAGGSGAPRQRDLLATRPTLPV